MAAASDCQRFAEMPRVRSHLHGALSSGWCKEELLEASMGAVLVGGSSVMTFVTLVDKAIQQHAAK